jgi:hypothetical protein
MAESEIRDGMGDFDAAKSQLGEAGQAPRVFVMHTVTFSEAAPERAAFFLE